MLFVTLYFSFAVIVILKISVLFIALKLLLLNFLS